MSASNMFIKIFKQDNLKSLYHSTVKYHSPAGIDGIRPNLFERKLDENISVILRKVLAGTYRFSQFKEKLIPRGPNRNPRVISIPTIRDKLVLRALYEVLISVYGNDITSLRQLVYGVTEVVSSGKKNGIIRLDVKNFYPSINHDVLRKTLRKKIRKKEILHLIFDSISQITVGRPDKKLNDLRKVGIPQGLSISNLLANVYMQPFDNEYGKLGQLRFFRYVDDILILCDLDEIDKLQNEVRSDCKKIGLVLHSEESSKTCIGEMCSGFDYLGYAFCGPLISVRKKTVDNLRASLIKIITQYRYSRRQRETVLLWNLNIRITGCIFNGNKYGWMFFFSQINDLKLVFSLDFFVRKQLMRYGLGSIVKKVKKFVRVYHEITKNLKHTNYVPKFDSYTIKDKTRVLRDIFNVKAILSDKEVESQFDRRIFRVVKDIERDATNFS